MLLDDNCCGQVMLSLPWWMKYTLWRRPFLSRGVLQRLDGPQCDQSTNKLRWDFSPAIDWKYCHQPFSWFAQFWAPADPRPALYEGKPGRGGVGGPEQLFLPPLSDRSFAAGTLPLPQGSTTPWRWTRGSLCRSTTTPTCSTSNRWHFQSRASSGYCQFTKVEVSATLSDGCEGEMSDSNSDKWVGSAVTRKGLKIGGKSKASKLPEFSQITSFPPAHKKQCPPCQPNNCTNSSEPIILGGNEGSMKFFKPRFKCKCI